MFEPAKREGEQVSGEALERFERIQQHDDRRVT